MQIVFSKFPGIFQRTEANLTISQILISKWWNLTNFQQLLRKKCPYLELFWSVFPRIWTEYLKIHVISPYSVQMWQNTDQNNSEYGQFSRSECKTSGSQNYQYLIGLIKDIFHQLHLKAHY